jgi:hypothetical protein
MPGMLSSHSSTRRFLAHLLAVSLLWALVGCVSICAFEVEESASLSSVELVSSHEYACCPIVSSRSLLPERMSLDVSGGFSPASSVFLISKILRQNCSTEIPALFPSPPLPGPHTLRI